MGNGQARSGWVAAQRFHDLDVVAQSARGVVAVPGDPVLGPDRRSDGAKGDAGMGNVFDLLPSQSDAEAFRNKAHEGWFEFSILKDSRGEAGGLTRLRQPLAKTWVGCFRHPD